MKPKRIALFIAPLIIVALAAACADGSESAESIPAESGGLSAEQFAAMLANGDGDGGSGISVSGLGAAVAVPDIATLSLGVTTQSATARGARDDAAARMTDLIDSLKDNGIAEDDYHTSQFSIDPDIDYRSNGEQVIRGYRVTSMLSVTVRDIDGVGEVIDDAVDAVGDPIRVNGVSFSIDAPAALQTEARAQAMADAKAKAEQLAELAGIGLGEPIAMSESSSGGMPPVFFDLRAAEADLSTPISPGQLEITVTVQVTYAIS